MSKHLVTIVDRPQWYVPIIEREIFGPAGIAVELGRVPNISAGMEAPAEISDADRLSRISAAVAPRKIFTADVLVAMAGQSDGIMVVGALVTEEVIERLPRLRVIGRYGIGLDNIDLDAARRRGIAVISAPGYCATEVADHTLMFILATSRRLMFLHGGLTSGHWLRNEASPMPALAGQTMGLVGFGEIARLVARRATAFGLKVVAYDPLLGDPDFTQAGVERMELDRLLAVADWVSLHVPLNTATRHIINKRALAIMKPNAVVVNTGRGPLVDEAALISALDAGHLGGAALDVFESEPLAPNHPLLNRDNVLLTPHIAGLSDESQEHCRRIVAQGVADVLTGIGERR
jgi:D-3-phosphoglycerate dehydrogenase